MGSGTKTSKKKKQIEEYKKELVDNDETLKKNKEQPDTQIQVGLKDRHYPPYPQYDVIIKDLKRDNKVFELMLKSKFKTINPTFEYETYPEWVEIQTNKVKESLEKNKKNLKQIKQDVEEVKNNLIAQNERIKERRLQIIDELKKLKVDVSEYTDKNKSYIG